MMTRWMRAAAAVLALPVLLEACAGSRAQLPTQQYVPTTREMMPLGQLELSNTLLKFGALDGEMKLQYVGLMPQSAGPDLAGASVYRVKNAAAYFRQNVGKNAFCSETPQWVAVSSGNGAPAWSSEIWVGLLTLEDWATFKHAVDKVCAGGDYVRTGG